MGLSAALYSGTSGLRAHGEAMTVIGNNIANVSTVGFKGSRLHFEDALSQATTTAAGVGQIGRGVQVGTVMADFAQGSLASTTESTDLAIGGSGFFVVSPPGEDINYYTRAGNFRFDSDGKLTDPHGYVVQGWKVKNETNPSAATGTQAVHTTAKIEGVPTDIVLENFQSPPQATSHVDIMTNLDSQSIDRAKEDPSNLTPDPMFAMFKNWDGTADEPLADTKYTYQTTLKVYDQNGTSHNMTVYFDPVKNTNVAASAKGDQVWEYMVTVPPAEDGRTLIDGNGTPDNTADDTDYPLTGTKAAGVLMVGTLTFNPAGELVDTSAFTLPADLHGMNTGNLEDLNNWRPADFSAGGYPLCTANFVREDDASGTTDENAKNIEINFGLQNTTTNWTGNAANAAAVGTDINNLPSIANPQISALSATSYNTGSTTLFQSQDGFGAGFLQGVSVNRDGILIGSYSNGQVLELYALTLADFNDQYSLYREGGNLFSETSASGAPLTGLANTRGKGAVASNSLEQSNVDLATEFVDMITTQKGYQANSKTITTTDQMLDVLINMKR
ncbi:MAG: flagellar biosynthesis protein FlgE [Deltaproteobacteria bacterium]|nr:MAG: flagellar biosynthesis protein FlgE [Deltaproteobacteria bacterium]